MRLLSTLSLISALLLTGCLAEEDKSVTNEQGEDVNDVTAALNGFWDGVLNAGATSEANMRVLIYNGNLYGLDENNGYYGTLVLNPDDETAIAALTSYALSTDSEADAEMFIANGSEAEVDLDVQQASIAATNDSLFGSFSIDGTASGNIEMTREDTWTDNAPLSK
ncbi:hypothetical protein, partial [Thalassolituus sp. UBA1505]